MMDHYCIGFLVNSGIDLMEYLESTLLLVPTGVDGAEYDDDRLLELSSDPDLDLELELGFGPRFKTDSE
jgi:hypothetical protein